MCHVSHTLSRPDFCAIIPFLQGSQSERKDEFFEPLTAQAMTIITTNLYGIETAAAGDFDVRLFASRCEAASVLLSAVGGAEATAGLASLGGSTASQKRRGPRLNPYGGDSARDSARISRQPRGSGVAREAIRAPNPPLAGAQRVMRTRLYGVCVHVYTVFEHCNGRA